MYREEGTRRLFSGASTATSRAVLMTIGQLSFYDQIKITLLGTSYFKDDLVTHFVASLSAVLLFIFPAFRGAINSYSSCLIGSYSYYYDTTFRCSENSSNERQTWGI